MKELKVLEKSGSTARRNLGADYASTVTWGAAVRLDGR